MVPPLTGSSLIPHRRYAQSVRAGPGQRTKEATMTIKLVALILLCLMSGTAVAQEPKVTSLMSKDLPENPELSLKVGDGGNRKGGISWGCLTPPLLHRRSDMPCPKNSANERRRSTHGNPPYFMSVA